MPDRIIHIAETEAIRDFAPVLRHIDEGAEVVIYREGKRSLGVRPRLRTVEEALAIAKTFTPVIPDADMAKNTEEGMRPHQHWVETSANRMGTDFADDLDAIIAERANHSVRDPWSE